MRRLPVLSIASLPWFVALAACGGEGTQTKEGAGGSGGGSSGTQVIWSSGAGNAPSTKYPAPHPAAPSVADLGGPVLSAPKFQPIFFDGDDPSFPEQVQTFVNDIGATDYWAAIGSEYGVGPATGLPVISLAEVPDPSITDLQVQAWLRGKIEAGAPFPAPDANTLYTVFYPSGVSITLSGGGQVSKSCREFGGYHSSLKLTDGTSVPYAVIPRCKDFNGFQGIDMVTAATSHEFIEASTDPFPGTKPAYSQPDNDHYYWAYEFYGGEVGDMCAAQITSYTTFPEFPFVVQRSWSNASAAAGHDPCVPALPDTVYFNAAVVLPDVVSVAGVGAMHAIKIKQGETKTVEVDLFSDGDTGGPWNVSATDLSPQLGDSAQLYLSFEEFQGQNGQKLKLDITVVRASIYHEEVFTITSELNGIQNIWVGLVSN